MPANDKQVGGNHYRTEIQHWDWAAANELDYFQGCITKYVARHKKNSGILSNATSIREQIANQRFNKIIIETDYDDINPISHEEIVDKYLGSLEKQNGIDGPIVAYSNKSVQHFNEAVRSRIFPDKKTIQTAVPILILSLLQLRTIYFPS